MSVPSPATRALWTRRLALGLIITLLLSLGPEIVANWGEPNVSKGVAEPSRVVSTNVVGNAEFVVYGSSKDQGNVLYFGSATGEIRLEFREPIEIAALQLESSLDSEFLVDVSRDAEFWTPVWEVRPEPRLEIEIRRTILTTPTLARFLRIRNQNVAYGEVPTIRALRVYAKAPEANAWPGLRPPPRQFPWLTGDEINLVKLILALVGATLAGIIFFSARRESESKVSRGMKRAYVTIAVFAGLGWWNFFQISNSEFESTHRHYKDIYHYYLGAKFAPELRYENLIRCQLAADSEDGFRQVQLTRRLTRDLQSNELVPTSQVLAEAEQCTSRFSKDRWAKFKLDNAWFRMHMPPMAWLAIGTDHGYNASPAFAVLGRPLSSLGPMSEPYFVLLASIDSFFISTMWLIAWFTFGWRGTCAALLYWGTNLVANDREFLVGSFMRLDSMFLVITGICALKTRRMGLAGFLLGCASLLRIFPGFLLVGIGIKILWDAFSRRSLLPSAPHRRLILGVLSAAMAVFILGSAAAGGPSAWNDFVGNTLKHSETPQLQNMGMGSLIAYIDRSDLRVKPRVTIQQMAESHSSDKRKLVKICLTLLVIPLLFLAVYREETWVAAMVGVVLLPFISDVNNYYWWLLTIFGFLTTRSPALILSFSSLTVAFALLGFHYPIYALAQYTWASLAMMLFLMTVLMALCWK